MTTYLYDVLSGAASGATGCMATQWLVNWKLDQQKNIQTIWHPKLFSAGLGAAIPGDALSVAIQNSVFESIKGPLGKYPAALLGGAVSAIPLTTCEILMDYHRQNIEEQRITKSLQRPSYLKTVMKMIHKNGSPIFFKGMKCTMGREAINSMAWILWTDRVTQSVEPYVTDPRMAKIVGGVLSGTMAAVLSHPLDTMKVKIQNGLTTGYMHQEMFKAIETSYRSECAKLSHTKAITKVSRAVAREAFKGVSSRAGVLAIYIPCLHISHACYDQILKTHFV